MLGVGPQPAMVLDWNGRRVGEVRDVLCDPRTHMPTSLIVALAPEARSALRVPERTLVIPFQFVHGLRRGEVTLNRRLGDTRMWPMPPAAGVPR